MDWYNTLSLSVYNYSACQEASYYKSFVKDKIVPLISQRSDLGYTNAKINKDDLPNSMRAVQYIKDEIETWGNFLFVEFDNYVEISWKNTNYQIYRFYKNNNWSTHNVITLPYYDKITTNFIYNKQFEIFSRNCLILKRNLQFITDGIFNQIRK